MIYEEKTYKQSGNYVVKTVQGYSPLISILKISQQEYSATDQQLSSEQEILIRMHPIFIRQIDSKFIKVPEDLLKRTVIAYGGDRISEATLKLRDYLIRAHSYKALGDLVIGTVNSVGSTTSSGNVARPILDFNVEAAGVARWVAYNTAATTTATIPAGTIFATALRYS